MICQSKTSELHQRIFPAKSTDAVNICSFLLAAASPLYWTLLVITIQKTQPPMKGLILLLLPCMCPIAAAASASNVCRYISERFMLMHGSQTHPLYLLMKKTANELFSLSRSCMLQTVLAVTQGWTLSQHAVGERRRGRMLNNGILINVNGIKRCSSTEGPAASPPCSQEEYGPSDRTP